MYVVVGTETYETISALQFNPEADLTGSSVPVNEFWVTVHTDDDIPVGSRISLMDDEDNTWAKYWVTYSERAHEGARRVHAQSSLMKLDQIPLEPIMYSSTTVSDALEDVLSSIDDYELDEDVADVVLDGYCPKQTARVRLQWICMVSGAYLKEYFTDHLEILPYETVVETFVDQSRVFWKPKITYKDYVTAITATYYEYTAGTPTRTDEYVEVDGTIYVQQEDTVTLANPDVPEIALENVIELSGVTLVNQSNVDAILSRLASYNFNRTELSQDIIDNGDVTPGQAVVTYADENMVVAGFVRSASFKFGQQARASLQLMGCEVRASGVVEVRYVWDDVPVGMKLFCFPVGYEWETKNPYIEVVTGDGHRYVLRPTSDTCSGTMTSGRTVVTQQMAVALEYLDGSLRVVSVDELNVRQDAYPNGDLVVIT